MTAWGGNKRIVVKIPIATVPGTGTGTSTMADEAVDTTTAIITAIMVRIEPTDFEISRVVLVALL